MSQARGLSPGSLCGPRGLLDLATSQPAFSHQVRLFLRHLARASILAILLVFPSMVPGSYACKAVEPLWIWNRPPGFRDGAALAENIGPGNRGPHPNSDGLRFQSFTRTGTDLGIKENSTAAAGDNNLENANPTGEGAESHEANPTP
ncbi:hypothetical protein H4Q26_013752 [Puccinia striiformis f. sp. tritici PST-130]|nr:hypothetical protein H4Q26_013752 [Puccinia striiformis f. sp. tritici PST-130]